jgi:hypothetical protein
MASENCAPGWSFSAALVNHDTAFSGQALRHCRFGRMPHHGHGAGIAIIGPGFGYLSGGFEFLVLEQSDGFFKAGFAKRALVNMSRSDRTYFIRPSVA